MASRRTLTIGVAVAGVLAALLVAGYWAIYAGPPQSTERLAEAPKAPPQLYCMLIRYSGQPGLEFLFNISQVGPELHFEQIYLVEIRGSDKTIKQPPFPEWRFDASAEPARLESEISVFDNSAAGSHTEKITIELYDYRPEQGNRKWIESGLKSIHYQNLSGQCQQTQPVPLVSTSN
jgi:hypothetical protein